MTCTIPASSPKAASAAAFGRELVRACEARGIPRTEIHRATGIGRTTLDNYRTGYSLPKLEAASTLAEVLRWPRLREIVVEARTKACARCGRPFHNDGGNMGAKRYCSPECREVAASDAAATRRTRQAGQTGDGRRRYQALARLRSGIRIAEAKTAELRGAVDAMCRSCEPEGVCRTADCPLRGFSPLPLGQHDVGVPRTMADVRREIARKSAPQRSATMVRRHAEGLIQPLRPGDTRHPANDPLRREAWLAAQRKGHKARPRRPQTPEHRAAISAALRAHHAAKATLAGAS